jgi:hypothetical protein
MEKLPFESVVTYPGDFNKDTDALLADAAMLGPAYPVVLAA